MPLDLTPVPTGVDVRVNTTTTGTQETAAVIALADGGFVVTWASSGQDGGTFGIFGQRYNANGMAVGGEFQINTYTPNNQFFPSMSALANGGFVVTWSSFGQDGSFFGIYGQRYNADGTPAGSEFRVNSTTAGEQTFSSVTTLADGGFVVTWSSDGQDGAGNGIYGQRFDSSGAATGGEFLVNTYTTSEQISSDLTALDDGGFLVTWASIEQDGSGFGIYGQRYHADGQAAGLEFRVNATTTGDQSVPSIAALEDGGYVVTWASALQDGNSFGVFGRRYDANGVAGAEFQVNTYVTGVQTQPCVVALGDGGFVVTWPSNGQDGNSWGMYGQRFNAAGSAVGSEFRLNNTTAGSQLSDSFVSDPGLTVLADGRLVQVFYGDGEVYYRLVGVPPAETEVPGSSPSDRRTATLAAEHFVGTGTTQFRMVSYATSNAAVSADLWLYIHDLNTAIGGTAQGDWYTNINALLGSNFNDTLGGGSDHDLLIGGGGNDTLNGRDSDDQLIGGAGADNFNGGDGSDLLYIDAEDLVANIIGGADTDHAIVTTPAAVNLALTDANSIEIVIGNMGNDTIDASAVTGSMILYGGDDTDTLTLGAGGGFAFGQAGNDTLYGGSSGDNLLGGAGNDVFNGGGGNDVLYIDSADAVAGIDGGTGADYAIVETTTAVALTLTNANSIEIFVGNAGADVVDASAVTTAVVLYGGEGGDTLTLGAGGNYAIGQGGNDTLNGGTGIDVLIGGAGVDVFNGGDGNDVIYFDAQDLGNGQFEAIVGGGGIDYAINDGAAGAFWQLTDANGIEIVIGSSTGGDLINARAVTQFIYLYGGGGGDILDLGSGGGYAFGETGADFLTGGTSVDIFYGGTEIDYFSVGHSLAADYVVDFDAVGGEQINVIAANVTAFNELTITALNPTLSLVQSAGLNLYVGVDAAQLTAANFVFVGGEGLVF